MGPMGTCPGANKYMGPTSIVNSCHKIPRAHSAIHGPDDDSDGGGGRDNGGGKVLCLLRNELHIPIRFSH